MPEDPFAARFPTTHWSRVVAAVDRATPEARAALAELCRAYWYPLYAFIRRKGHGPDDAQDLVQGFFAALLERDGLAAERLFERRWAMTLLEQAVSRLRAEMDRAGKATLFDRLQPALAGEPGADRYAAIAHELGTTEAAVKAARRLRPRYSKVLREEIARIVADPAAIEEEVRSLFVALGR
jgi:RNA polymerase sigma-70 factor (ECF subfamily)